MHLPETWSPTALVPAALLALGLSAAPVPAQTVRGRLLDEESRQPIMLGSVFLSDTAGVVIDQTVTNHEGRFVLQSPEPGAFLVGASRAGYTSRIDGVLEMGAGGEISVDFFLAPDPIAMEGLNVDVSRERVDAYLAQSGFYDRRDGGSGTYFDPERLEGREGMRLSTLLEGVPGLTTRIGGSANIASGRLFARDAASQISPSDGGRLRGTGAVQDSTEGAGFIPGTEGYCTPRLFVDGVESGMADATPGLAIDDFLNLEAIVAIEAYPRVAHIPIQYGGSNSSCGIILIWTKGGAAGSG